MRFSPISKTLRYILKINRGVRAGAVVTRKKVAVVRGTALMFRGLLGRYFS